MSRYEEMTNDNMYEEIEMIESENRVVSKGKKLVIGVTIVIIVIVVLIMLIMKMAVPAS